MPRAHVYKTTNRKERNKERKKSSDIQSIFFLFFFFSFLFSFPALLNWRVFFFQSRREAAKSLYVSIAKSFLGHFSNSSNTTRTTKKKLKKMQGLSYTGGSHTYQHERLLHKRERERRDKEEKKPPPLLLRRRRRTNFFELKWNSLSLSRPV